MISRRKLDALVERVLRRLVEAPIALARTEPSPDTGPTQYPSTPASPKTVPAARSAAEQEMSRELTGKNVRNPKAAPMSQKSMKVTGVKKALDAMGWTAEQGVGDAELNKSLSAWYDTLDPSDALVSTAQQLAQRWTEVGR